MLITTKMIPTFFKSKNVNVAFTMELNGANFLRNSKLLILEKYLH